MTLIVDHDPMHRCHQAISLHPGTVVSLREGSSSRWLIGTLLRIRRVLTERGLVFVEVTAVGEKARPQRLSSLSLAAHLCPDCPHEDSPEAEFEV
jgi:hypothetical protein